MKRLGLILLLALLAVPASGATIYVDNNGSNTAPYETCAKAANLLSTAVTAWTAGDVIWVNDQHSETTAAGVTYSSANDTMDAPLLIYSVDFSDGAGGCSGTDAYTPGSASQIAVTGAGNDLQFQGSFAVYGLYAVIDDNFLGCLTGENAVSRFHDLTIEFNSAAGAFNTGNEPNCQISLYNLSLMSEGAGDTYFVTSTAADAELYGVSLADTVESAGAFRVTGNVTHTFFGPDLSALTGTPTLYDASVGSDGDDSRLILIGGSLPASYAATDGAEDEGDELWMLGMDVVGAGANVSRTELHGWNGTVKVDYATYRDSGWSDTDGGNLSYAFVADSAMQDGRPLCSWPISAWLNTTGSTTFTAYINHDFTASPTKAEVWLETLYLGTTNSTLWTLDRGEDVLGSTATTGTSETWTEPSCDGGTCTDEKISETVTVNKAGLWQIRICTSKYEANKTLWVDPLIDVS